MTSQRWTALVAISIFMLVWLDATPTRADTGTTPAADPAPPANPTSPAKPPSPAAVSAAIKRFENGRRLANKGDYAAAIGEFEQAYQLDPKTVHLYNLAVTHHLKGDRDKAIDYYHRFLAAEPDSKLAPDAERYALQLEAEAAKEQAAEAKKHEEEERDEAKKAWDEVKVAQERAEKAEQALRNVPQSWPTVATYPRLAPLPPPPLPPPTIDQGIAEDANAGRSWAMPTALTAPAGTVTLSDFEFLGLSASYSFTDRLSMGLTLVLPSHAYSWNTKLQLVRSERVQIAAQGILARFEGNPSNAQAGMATLAGAGGAITLCIDLICRSHLSGLLGAGVGVSPDDHIKAQLIGASSLVLGIGQKLKLLLELDAGTGIAAGVIGWYGLRLTSKSFGLDLGYITPLSTSNNAYITKGVPFIQLTLRGYGR